MSFEYIGYLAAFLTTFSFVPQAIKTIRTQDTAGISLLMYSMFCIGIFFWLLYGLYLNDLAITLSNAITFLLSSTILFCKVRNVLKGKESAL